MATIAPFGSDTHPYTVRHMDTVGDASGSHDANVNGSVTPVLFRINPPAQGVIVLTQLTAIVEMAGNFTTVSYGSLTALTNGIRVGFWDKDTEALLSELTAAHAIQSNADWAMYANDVQLNAWGGGNSMLVAKWNIADTRTSIVLPAGSQAAVGIEIRDNLSTLATHEFIAHGYTVGV